MSCLILSGNDSICWQVAKISRYLTWTRLHEIIMATKRWEISCCCCLPVFTLRRCLLTHLVKVFFCTASLSSEIKVQNFKICKACKFDKPWHWRLTLLQVLVNLIGKYVTLYNIHLLMYLLSLPFVLIPV